MTISPSLQADLEALRVCVPALMHADRVAALEDLSLALYDRAQDLLVAEARRLGPGVVIEIPPMVGSLWAVSDLIDDAIESDLSRVNV